jgi:alkylmercury lyase
MIRNARVDELTRTLRDDVLDYGPDRSRLLLRALRALASAEPVTWDRVDRLTADLGLSREDATQFLRRLTERDADDNILGIMGLSLNAHRHRFTVNGKRMSTWCAEDTLFLPALLNQSAVVESYSPTSGEPVRLIVGPETVHAVTPPDAVVSIVVPAVGNPDMSSVESIWTTFCHHIHFFPSRAEAERWAAGRTDIEILSVAEAHELGRQVWSKVLRYEAPFSRK